MYTLTTTYQGKITCFVCDKEMDLIHKKGFMECQMSKHYCHKKCLKKLYKQEYNEKLDAGYIYSSGTNLYKKHQCPCGKTLTTHNKLSWKLKKVGKFIWIPILVIALV